MRLRVLIRWVVILVVVGWAGYTIVAAGSNYLAMQEMVDTVLQEHDKRRRAGIAAGAAMPPEQFADEVRASLRVASRRTVLTTAEPLVLVATDARALRVTVKWAYPLLTYGGDNVISVPLTVGRTLELF
jgi:hypothetical protein